jgi:hypothetical protein
MLFDIKNQKYVNEDEISKEKETRIRERNIYISGSLG